MDEHDIAQLGDTAQKELLKESKEALRVVQEHGHEIFHNKSRSSSSKDYEPHIRTTSKRTYFFMKSK